MEYYNKIDNTYLNALKQNIIKPVIKIELMDFSENIIGELTQDLSKDDSGSISINYQQGVRRSCSLTLINVNKNLKLNESKYFLNENNLWINTKFKLYTGIKILKVSLLNEQELGYNNQSNTDLVNNNILYKNEESSVLLYRNSSNKTEEDIYWFSQGVYLLTNPSVLRDMSKKTITLNGIDKFGALGSETNFIQTTVTHKIEEGTIVRNVIYDILNFDRGDGLPIDVKEPYIDPNIKIFISEELGEVPLEQVELPFDIQKSPETYWGDILIELANIYACDVYYDTEGRLHFEKGNEKQSMDDFSSIWDYSDKEPEYFSPQLNYNFQEVYNVVKVVGNNPTKPLFVHTAKNIDPFSPTRISLIGEKILYIESSFCYNEDRTVDFANYMLNKKNTVPLSLSFQSAFIPHLDVNKVITITDDYFKYYQQRFIIQSLTIPLNTKSLIDIEATNTSNIPYFEY